MVWHRVPLTAAFAFLLAATVVATVIPIAAAHGGRYDVLTPTSAPSRHHSK